VREDKRLITPAFELRHSASEEAPRSSEASGSSLK